MLAALIYPMYMFPVEVEAPETMIATETVDSEIYTITAYTAGPESTGKSPGHPQYGLTASGEYVQEGVTAACAPDIPFGTVIEIERLGERICLDRGSAIQGNRIDVYIPEVKDALEFGVQELEVRVVSE